MGCHFDRQVYGLELKVASTRSRPRAALKPFETLAAKQPLAQADSEPNFLNPTTACLHHREAERRPAPSGSAAAGLHAWHPKSDFGSLKHCAAVEVTSVERLPTSAHLRVPTSGGLAAARPRPPGARRLRAEVDPQQAAGQMPNPIQLSTASSLCAILELLAEGTRRRAASCARKNRGCMTSRPTASAVSATTRIRSGWLGLSRRSC